MIPIDGIDQSECYNNQLDITWIYERLNFINS